MSVLVTGANGFIGYGLCQQLVAQGRHVYGGVRTVEASGRLPEGVEPVVIGSLNAATSWDPLLKGIDTVIHLAAITAAEQSLEEFSSVNVAVTASLAGAAAQSGVRRLIFLSTIKVYGETSQSGHPWSSVDPAHPQTPYARSKWEAEQALAGIARQTPLEVVVIRPPLVYGPGVKGNFRTLWHWVERGLPLPLGAVRNRRSLVARDNLNDLIITCIDHPAAAGQTFLVSDGQDLSTPELLRAIARVQGRAARLLPLPPRWLNRLFALCGRKDSAARLLGSLQVDISTTCQRLDWQPPLTVDEGLARCRIFSARPQILIRLCDVLLAAAALLCGLPLFILLTLAGFLDTGKPLFRQQRLGRNQEPFCLLKFRTMKSTTASVASHLVEPDSITGYGQMLRRTKLDELPQLWNVLKGDMSLVGPRPCLPNQHELIAERERCGVFSVRPGITGRAQLSGIDMSTPELLAETDARMIHGLSLKGYVQYLVKTALGKGTGDAARSNSDGQEKN